MMLYLMNLQKSRKINNCNWILVVKGLIFISPFLLYLILFTHILARMFLSLHMKMCIHISEIKYKYKLLYLQVINDTT